MIERILPLHAVGADTVRGADAQARVVGSTAAVPVFPEELALVAGATAKRRQEFLAGRRCARRALRGLGRADTPLVPGPEGGPQWPEGVTGSITHCPGYQAAAVAPRTALAALGIDAEPNEPLEKVMWSRVFRPSELAFLRAQTGLLQPVHWDRLIFSAKEAVYKAWRPLTGTWLGFHDAHITVVPETAGQGRFAVRLIRPPGSGRAWPVGSDPDFAGRWMVADGLLVTVVAVPCR